MIKFKKILVGLGTVSKVYIVVWFLFMLAMAGSGAGVEMLHNSDEYPIGNSMILISLPLIFASLILALVGHLVYFSGFIETEPGHGIVGHKWDENWRDR